MYDTNPFETISDLTIELNGGNHKLWLSEGREPSGAWVEPMGD